MDTIVVVTEGKIKVVYIQIAAITQANIIQQVGEDLLKAVDAWNKPKIVINFTKVTHLSSSFISKLVVAMRSVKEVKGTIKLCCMRPAIQEIFKITKLDKVFEIHPTQERAIKSFKSGIFGS